MEGAKVLRGCRRGWGLWPVLAGLLVVWLVTGCATRQVSPVGPPKPVLRIEEGTNGTVALQVAVRDLVPRRKKDPVVRLVGVTHLGAKEYYAALQGLLDGERLVLFEGVGATNKQFRAANEGYSLQPALAKALGLQFQLHAIDYSGSNFVNSDLTLEEMGRVMSRESRKEGGGGGGEKAGSGAGGTGGAGDGEAALGDLVSMMDGSSWAGVFLKFGVAFIGTSPKLRATVKLLLIETLGSMEGDLGQAKGMPPSMQRLMEVLIRERNTAVIRDVSAAVARGRRSGRERLASVAVFYGAGHLADLEKRICEELGYRPSVERWYTAFEVNPGKAGLGPADVAAARRMVRDQLKTMGMRKGR